MIGKRKEVKCKMKFEKILIMLGMVAVLAFTVIATPSAPQAPQRLTWVSTSRMNEGAYVSNIQAGSNVRTTS